MWMWRKDGFMEDTVFTNSRVQYGILWCISKGSLLKYALNYENIYDDFTFSLFFWDCTDVGLKIKSSIKLLTHCDLICSLHKHSEWRNRNKMETIMKQCVVFINRTWNYLRNASFRWPLESFDVSCWMTFFKSSSIYMKILLVLFSKSKLLHFIPTTKNKREQILSKLS